MQVSVILLGCLLLGDPISLQPLTPGNIVISCDNTIKEYTRAGVLVQSTSVPYPGSDSTPKARDLVVDRSGNVEVFNGTFDPYLSALNVAQGTWSHLTFTGWSLVNNGSYGGLATSGRYVYAPDMSTSGDGQPQGIVRFDLSGGTTIRFAATIEPFDVNVGLDGLLYAMYPGASPSGTKVRVFDPTTLAEIRTMDISVGAGSHDFRGIAADSDGSLFVVGWDETAYHLNSAGDTLLDTLSLPVSDTFDIDIGSDGTVLIGSRFGKMLLTDRDFSSSRVLTVGSGNAFGTLVVPEPGTGILVAFPLLVASFYRRRRRRESKRRHETRETRARHGVRL
jgi:hypothetical protein